MAVADVILPEIELPHIVLPTEDGEPLETSWHRDEISLLIDSLRQHWAGRSDYYVGGNMFVYYSFDQVRNRDYRGPDFYVVLGVDGSYEREAWVVWEEGGRYPNVIVELLSPSTAETDRTTKKALYEETFRTPEYFCYDPWTQELQGWRLVDHHYEEIAADERGWLWSRQLQLWLGLWQGSYLSKPAAAWLRFYDAQRNLVLTHGEAKDRLEAEQARRADAEARARREEARRADAEAQRAAAEAQRAQAAEAKLAELQARLRAAGLDPE